MKIEPSDNSYLVQACRGDPSAFTQLYRRSFDAVYHAHLAQQLVGLRSEEREVRRQRFGAGLPFERIGALLFELSNPGLVTSPTRRCSCAVRFHSHPAAIPWPSSPAKTKIVGCACSTPKVIARPRAY